MSQNRRWARLQVLFEGALAIPRLERDEYLRHECAGDEGMLAEVQALLDADRTDSDRRFAGLIGGAASALVEEEEPARWEGRVIGPYRLVREIARGGMGTVYLAERADAAYQARVAIKFARGVVAGHEVVRRFLAERQILADLEHPRIARLLDGGATDDGTPFLVMEYIDGEPIDAFADNRNLDVPARLALFRSVCDAVQHAHRRLVVHRDIKPSNILIAPDGTPKLLDFGVAKLLDPSGEGGITQTSHAGGLLTPAYASPEQVRGDPVTTATDVYALGVLLYRLLTGVLPYGAGTRSGMDLGRAILDEPPEPPSRSVASTAPDEKRGHGRTLDSDIDAIVLTALEKEPSRRYPSVEHLSDDIARYLARKPVVARPATRAYQVRKFVSRYRRAVVTTTATFIAGLGLVAFYTVRLARERDVALQETRKAEQVTAFLERLFAVSDPSEARGNTITAREVLDSAAARAPDELADQPEVQAALLYTLGGVYANLGLEREAGPILERGLTLRLGTGEDVRPTPGEFLRRLGEVEIGLGRFDSATALLRGAISRLDFEPRLTEAAVGARLSLVNALRRAGRLEEADSLTLDAIVRARESGSDTLIANGLTTRAAVLINQRKGAEAEPLAREAWERYVAIRGEDAPVTILTLSNLGQALFVQSKYAEAEPILRRVLELYRRVTGEESPQAGLAWNNLSALLQAQGRPREAEVAARRALAVWRGSYGDRHQRVTLVMSNLGSMLRAQGKLDEAERMQRAALRIMREILPAGHLDIAVAHNNLAHAIEEADRYVDAETEYRAAAGELAKGALAESPVRGTFLANLGRVIDLQGRSAEAEETLRRALTIQRELIPGPHANTATTLALLGDLLVRRGRAAEGESLLREALVMREKVLAPDHWGIQVTRSALGRCLAAQGRTAEADSLLTRSAAALEERLGLADERTRTALERAAGFYEQIGDRDRAEAARQKLGEPRNR
jgi:serine/threonine-protein kinase